MQRGRVRPGGWIQVEGKEYPRMFVSEGGGCVTYRDLGLQSSGEQVVDARMVEPYWLQPGDVVELVSNANGWYAVTVLSEHVLQQGVMYVVIQKADLGQYYYGFTELAAGELELSHFIE